MAKKKTNISFIFKLLVLILGAFTIVSFFLPSFGSTDSSIEVKYSNCQMCFLSKEKAEEKSTEYTELATKSTIKGNSEEAKKYTAKAASYGIISSFKSEDFEGETSAVIGAWLHFGATIISAVAIAVVILSLFKKGYNKASIIALLTAMVFMICSLICGISMLNTEIGLGILKDDMNFRFGGVILGLISSTLASISAIVPCFFNKKKKSN